MTAPHRSAKDGAALVVAEVLGLSSLHGRPRPPRLIDNQGNQPPRMATGGGGGEVWRPKAQDRRASRHDDANTGFSAGPVYRTSSREGRRPIVPLHTRNFVTLTRARWLFCVNCAL